MNEVDDQNLPSEKPQLDPINQYTFYQLPNEVLEEIFSTSIQTEGRKISGHTYRSVIALCLTCKRFHGIAQRLLYRDLSFATPTSYLPTPRRVELFYRSLKANPGLGMMCRHLSVRMSSFSFSPKFRLLGEILSTLRNLTKLKVRGSFDVPETWSMITEAMKSMPCLHEVDLGVDNRPSEVQPVGPPLQRICYDFDLPNIRVLKLYGAFAEHATVVRGSTATKMPFRGLVDTYKEHTAPFTSLHIAMPNFNSSAFTNLLTWPKALEHFFLSEVMDSSSDTHDFDFALLETALKPHRASLKSLTLCYVHRNQDSINLTGFPELESLQVDSRNLRMSNPGSRMIDDSRVRAMVEDAGLLTAYESHVESERERYRSTVPETMASTMLGPKVRFLVLDFRSMLRHHSSRKVFGGHEAEWIRRFAEQVKEQDITLCKITPLFPLEADWKDIGTDDGISGFDGDDDDDAPGIWRDSVEWLEEELEQLDIKLSYQGFS